MTKFNRLIISILAVFSIHIAAAQDHGKLLTDTFRIETEKERAKKDAEFRTTGMSPLPEDEIAGFNGLKYFPFELKYRVKARFERTHDDKIFKMKTTTARRPEYKHYANVYFVIDGKSFKLEVYQNVELVTRPGYEKHLFLPFSDETSGRTSYGGGRFLDLEIPDDDKIVIDFNKAYNPYCAYNHKYSCPVPPEQNDLPVKIEAGEKTYHE